MGRVRFTSIPGSKLPGYDQSVPPGRRILGTMTGSYTGPLRPSFEDDDEYENDFGPQTGERQTSTISHMV
jgi:hypothetical protein